MVENQSNELEGGGGCTTANKMEDVGPAAIYLALSRPQFHVYTKIINIYFSRPLEKHRCVHDAAD